MSSGYTFSPEEYFGSTINAHKAAMGIIWGPGINIIIFIAIYSYRKAWPIIHGIISLLVCVFSFISALPILVKTDMIPIGTTLGTHYRVGLASICLIGLQLLLGMATKIVNISQRSSKAVLIVRKMHAILGYLMLFVCKASIYIIRGADNSAFLWAIDSVFFVLLIIRKRFFPRMQKSISPKQQSQPKPIKSLKQLEKDRSYVVFANYVYDTQPLKMFHPAGYQIIESVKNKEVDRYIYGMYASQELPEIQIHSHSYKSFTLMNAPVAKLSIPSPVQGFSEQQIPMRLSSLKLLSKKSQIYELLLVGEKDKLNFVGYTDVCQLGQYYSLSLNDKVTRLYTSVHFLHADNRIFMAKHLPNLKEDYGKVINVLPSRLQMMDKTIEGVNMNEDIASKCFPILFKWYSKGKFTEGLVNGPIEKLVLSKAKGEGLQFAHLKPGKVLIAAGGTGLYPFSDLIDLLFKDQLATDRPELRPAIEKLSPVLAARPFQALSFHLFAAFQSVDDVHPTTLQQLLYLSAHSARFALTLRLKEAARWLSGSKVELSGSGFEQLLGRQLRDLSGISRVWICGPPRMNEGLAKYLRETYKNSELYLIL